MEKETNLEKLKNIENYAKLAKSNLNLEFALSNAKFKIGDTIKDTRWAFTIDQITAFKILDFPLIVYHGFELKKDLTPKKNGSRVSIHGNNADLVKKAD